MKAKILIATTNSNKVKRIKNLMQEFNVEFIALSDLDYKIPEPEENQENALEIAKNKARYYYDSLKEKIPVLTQDDTMHLIGIKQEDNPGTNLKKPVIKKFGEATDENVIKYYSELAEKYGGYIDLNFVYGHGFCDRKNLEARESKLSGRLISKPKLDKAVNYPINSILQININGQWIYYSDLTLDQRVLADHELRDSIRHLLRGFHNS